VRPQHNKVPAGKDTAGKPNSIISKKDLL